MKVKILILLAVIFLLGNVSSAQGVGAYKAKKTEVVKVKKKNLVPQREGFFIMPEIEVGVGNSCEIYSIQCGLGYEFSRQLSLGVGFGINNYRTSAYSMGHYQYKKRMSISIPFYLHIGGILTQRMITPYYNLNIGMQKSLNKSYYHHTNTNVSADYYDDLYYYFNGLIISPELGLAIKNYHLGVNCVIVQKLIESIENSPYHPNSYYHNKNILVLISLKFGYKIPLNIGR